MILETTITGDHKLDQSSLLVVISYNQNHKLNQDDFTPGLGGLDLSDPWNDSEVWNDSYAWNEA